MFAVCCVVGCVGVVGAVWVVGCCLGGCVGGVWLLVVCAVVGCVGVVGQCGLWVVACLGGCVGGGGCRRVGGLPFVALWGVWVWWVGVEDADTLS